MERFLLRVQNRKLPANLNPCRSRYENLICGLLLIGAQVKDHYHWVTNFRKMLPLQAGWFPVSERKKFLLVWTHLHIFAFDR